MITLFERSRFQDFARGSIADPAADADALHCLSATAAPRSTPLPTRAHAVGASVWKPAQDHGFTYGRSFADLDGLVREVMWLDVAAAAVAYQAGADQAGADEQLATA